MELAIIAAVADNGVIGRDGDLPWRLPADLRRFKELTLGHHLLIGRRTWESIGRPLPGRTMVVLTRGGVELPEGVRAAGTLDGALAIAAAAGDAEAFVAGGAGLYREALPRAGRLYLTRVLAPVEGDVRFPDWDPAEWRRVETRDRPADAANPLPLRFEVWDRATPTPQQSPSSSSSRT
jgi:dihydrofolate reductase